LAILSAEAVPAESASDATMAERKSEDLVLKLIITHLLNYYYLLFNAARRPFALRTESILPFTKE
jgi:hypothetical protein